MASETAVQPSCTEENPDVDECQENIPPGVTAAAETSKLQVQVGDVIGCSSAQPSGENKHLSDPCIASTPAPASIDGAPKTRSRLSGLQSALTPILKYLNIGNKGSSPEPLKRGNGTRLSAPSFSLSVPTGQHKEAPVCWLQDEYLPEITLLNDTCDSTMQMTRNDSALPDSMPATPVTAKTVKSFSPLQPSAPSATTDNNVNDQKPCPQNETLSPLHPNVKGNSSEIHPPGVPKQNWTTTSTDFDAKMDDIPASMYAPERWLDDRYFPEITLLDVSRDSELSPGVQTPSVAVKQDNPLMDNLKNSKPSFEPSGHTVAEPEKLDMAQSEELSSTLTLTDNVTHTINSFSEQSDKCVEEDVTKASLEVTRDISMGSVLENSRSPSETSGENMVKSQTSAEGSLLTHPVNVTHDISSSSTVSVQCASAADVQGNSSLQNVTSDLYINPVETSNTADANNEELHKTHDELTGEEPQSSPESAKSANRTFTTDQSSSHNKTLDLPPSNGNSPKAEDEATYQVSAAPDEVIMATDQASTATDQVSTDFKNATETSLVMNHSTSADKAIGPCEVNNATFDRHSLQKSRGSMHLGEVSGTSFSIQNTFDQQTPKQNGTITLSETSDTHQNTFDKPSPSKVCNATTTLNSSEGHPPDLPKQTGTTGTAEATFEANSSVEVVSGADKHETEACSRSGLPVKDSLSESLGHQSMVMENNKANVFNLDDSLDLRLDALVTSTPMPTSKLLQPIIECAEGKTMVAQRKLYRGGPSNPLDQVPSNIVSDRKTFLTQPATKSFLPPAKVASQLLRYKPGSTFLGKCEPSASGLPMTRQRAQAEAVKATAAPDAPQGTTGISSSYNLRATTTGSKLPNSGMLRPPVSGISSGIQRPGAGLKPPSGKTNALASSSTNKLSAPAVTKPATKVSQAKKHPLTKVEALPTAKRKKMDVPPHSSGPVPALKRPTAGQRLLPAAKSQRVDAAVPTSTAETTCDAASRARGLLAKPQGHGCAKCAAMEEKIKIQSEEISRLKAELLKYTETHGGENSLP